MRSSYDLVCSEQTYFSPGYFFFVDVHSLKYKKKLLQKQKDITAILFKSEVVFGGFENKS